ncbi:hypothetical protein [Planotetraspora sp. GP83]|uniref:hypothetical protein n=1 Tax=Planotetraspora sp. GP83 TaxID=3156264 RepID=UPI0035134D7B
MTSQQLSLEAPHVSPPPQPRSPAEKENGQESGGVLAMLERISSVVVPVGVGLYAVLYMGITEVYNVFGVNPAQAGIDQSVLFSRLMGTLILLLVTAVPLLGVVVGTGWLLNKLTGGALSRLAQAIRQRPWIAASIAALWCGATYWGLFNVFADLHLTAMVIIAVGIGVLAFLIPFRLLRRKPVGRAGMKVLVGALSGIGVGFVLIVNLMNGATELRQTGQANLLLNLVGFQDQWTIVKDSDDKTLYDGRYMMQLGESDGTYIFYDCDKMETFRRSAEGTILSAIQLDPEREKGFTCGDLAKDDGPKDQKGSGT